MSTFQIKKIVADGNCLYRALSYFIYGTQASHKKMRQIIVRTIHQDWDEYKDFIIGNGSYALSILTAQQYAEYMGKPNVYGAEAEIRCFVEMYHCVVTLHIGNINNIVYGTEGEEFHLNFSGEYDNGHYDVILLKDVNNLTRKKGCKTQPNSAVDVILTKNIKVTTRPVCPIKKVCKTQTKSVDEKRAMISTEPVNEIPQYDIGDMEVVCMHCSGLSFHDEGGRVQNNCCHKGKIMLRPLHPYPQELKDLLLGTTHHAKTFRNNIRSYNSAFSFATFHHTNVENFNTNGPYLMKIQGQVYHITSSNLRSNDPRNGQIYIYDVKDAIEMRLKTNNTHRPIVEIIEKLLQDINSYSKRYKSLNEIYEEYEGAKEYCLKFTTYRNDDVNRYNIPLNCDVAALIISSDGSLPTNIDFCIYPKEGKEMITIKKTSQHVDPMCFPILFPYADLGWSYGMKYNNHNISALQYYSYRIAYRENLFSPILYSGRLSQHYIIHAYIIVESNRLQYLRFNQNSLRTECYQGVIDHIHNSNANTSDQVRLGNAIILPATYIGSPRNMQQLYLDAMVISRKVGRPDLFITMTCNPKWPEFQRVIKKFPPQTTVNDIPTIVCRVFHMKIKNLVKEIMSGKVFGPVVGYVYTIEFQKRGLPHCHILFILRTDQKLLTPEQLDQYISAEIPDKNKTPRLYNIVMKNMLHGPHSHNTPCWNEKDQTCSKKFPKPFTDFTDMSNGGYPNYRRRDNSSECHTYNKKMNNNTVYVDNRMVVPYNPYLLLKYNCHINTEYCASIMSIKYIHKYIHKGHDRAKFGLQNENDEITQYIDTRYLSAMESAWRLLELPLHDRSHSVVRLPVHLPNQQYVVFSEGHEKDIELNEKFSRTQLTAWFDINKTTEQAHHLLYADIPQFYRWENSTKTWVKRKNKINVISRIVNVSPKDTERFHLKLMLLRVRGVTSFTDIKTVNSKPFQTFHEAAIEAGITTSSEETVHLMNEAVSIMMPNKIRQFFVWYLIGEMPQDSTYLWNKYKSYMMEDCVGNPLQKEIQVLLHIQHMLHAEGYTLNTFALPTLPVETQQQYDLTDILHHNTPHDLTNNDITSLNDQQTLIFNEIISNLGNNNCYFIDGPGGTGKTYLYKALYQKMIQSHKIVACVAWTGIASILLPQGTTAHKLFNLPLYFNGNDICYLNNFQKKKLTNINVIIWDEASMISRSAIEIVNRTLQDLMNDQRPFGGKTMILGGDFRQLLPVIKRATKQQIISECIKLSDLWVHFKTFHLTENMRAQNDPTFCNTLLAIGNGDVHVIENKSPHMTFDVVSEMYQNIDEHNILHQAILATTNAEVNDINEKIIDMMNGDSFSLFSIDRATLPGIDKTESHDEECTLRYPIEYLNSISPSGLPPYHLKLKIGAVVMLVRNLSISSGLCNGTRLIVKKIYTRIIVTQILTGSKAGNIAEIPRIELSTAEDKELPFVLYRRQFPIKLAFAMTINKSQGQTFQKLGLHLEKQVFTHGQLYVAMSRCTSSQSIKIQSKHNTLNNIVYKEVLL